MRDDDPTAAVRAHKDPAEPAAVDGTRIMESAPPPTGPDPKTQTSTQLAEKSQRERRRERDRRAEKVAQRSLIAIFLAIGGAGWFVIQSGVLDDAPSDPTTTPEPEAGKSGAVPGPGPGPSTPKLTSGAVDEGSNLPAIHSMRSEGLTLAAEGLPEVVAVDPAMPPAVLAAIETCRFAYAIWEFSPNKAFRFLTTCRLLEGQVLVGGYEIAGSKVLTSPLDAGDGISLVSTFEIEKPSHVKTEVTVEPRPGLRVQLEVRQRITVIRAGMEGDGFHRTYAPKNTVSVQGLSPPPAKVAPPGKDRAPPPPPEKTKAKAKDPVLELLED